MVFYYVLLLMAKTKVLRRKNPAKRGRKKKGAVGYIPRILVQGMPADRAMATFVYSGLAEINTTTFSSSYGQFQCNSIYDPEITLQWRSNISNNRNSQPRYRDQIMGQLYSTYNVKSSNVKLTFINDSVGASDNFRAYVYCIGSGNGSSDSRPTVAGLVEEHPWVKRNGKVVDVGPSRGNYSKKSVSCSWSLANADPDDKINNVTGYGTAPSDYVPYFQFGIINNNDAVGTTTVKMFYTVTFNVELSEPIYQNVS